MKSDLVMRLSNLLTAAVCLFCAQGWTAPATAPADDESDTWVGTDTLGRSLPTAAEVGPPRSDKFVGIFYLTWHGSHSTGGPYDITKILAQDPDAMNKPESPLWGPLGDFHHWGEPLFGYYFTLDSWVIRKHAQMLSDAGVDVLMLDTTNNFPYTEQYLEIGKVLSESRALGNRTPQMTFLCPFGDASKIVRTLYDTLYGKGLYKDLWFMWQGKPLIMADPATVDPALRDFFTFRKPEPGYFEKPDVPNHWGWLDVFPQHVYKDEQGQPEQITVGVAQNSLGGKRITAMSMPNVTGRSWHDGQKDERPGAVLEGLNFNEQWKRALAVNPSFIFIDGWNEWVASRFTKFGQDTQPVMFVDMFTEEYSRDVEPMKGGHGDNYYYQMASNIRRFKGVRSVPTSRGVGPVKIDADLGDWAGIGPEYRDTIGDTAARDYRGYGQEHYRNTSGRNDIVLSKVWADAGNVYFYVRTREPLVAPSEPGWMVLYIDADQNHATGWTGYDLVLNRQVGDGHTASLECSTGGWSWTAAGTADEAVKGNELEVRIPRQILLAAGAKPKGPLSFDFKWADHSTSTGEVSEFTTQGDVAPNDRYNYRFIGQ